jgi:hypothetical protein
MGSCFQGKGGEYIDWGGYIWGNIKSYGEGKYPGRKVTKHGVILYLQEGKYLRGTKEG